MLRVSVLWANALLWAVYIVTFLNFDLLLQNIYIHCKLEKEVWGFRMCVEINVLEC